MNMICEDCDFWEAFGLDCHFYFKNKKSCTKRQVNGENKPIYDSQECDACSLYKKTIKELEENIESLEEELESTVNYLGDEE